MIGPHHKEDEQTPLIQGGARSRFETVERKAPALSLPPVKAARDRMHAELKYTVRKQTRGRKTVGAYRRKFRDASSWRGRVGVHVTIDEVDLKLLSGTILINLPEWRIEDHYDVIQLWQPFEDNVCSGGSDAEDAIGTKDDSPRFDAAIPEVFVFSFGAVVFWNFTNEDSEKEWLEKHILSAEEACGDPYHEDAVEAASDEIEFCYADTFKIHRDVVHLSTKEQGEKLAVSFGFAKSSLLSIFEWRLEKTIERNSRIPEELARTGHIHLTRNEISKEIGRIFLVRQGINLENNIQDTPEELWEDDRFQEHYSKTMMYFDITQRLNLINSRLGIIHDLHQVLVEAVQNHHGIVLEWIIIILIVVECVIEFSRFLQGDA